MLFSKAIFALSTLAAFVSAQSTTGSPAPSGSVTVHVVKALVKDGKPIFEPNEVQAAAGDLVQFQFYPLNHSVVRAAFADPCVPIEDSPNGNGTAGFFSGFMPVGQGSMMPTFTIQVNDTKPIWFYCSQGRHCQSGMVGAINPTAQRTLADFTSRAAQAPANLSPGEQGPEGGFTTSIGSGYKPTPTTMGTYPISGTSTGTATGAVSTGAASKLGSSLQLVLAAAAASFFFL